MTLHCGPFSFSVPCGNPPPAPNYGMMMTETRLSATYGCEEGYMLEGGSSWNCMNGQWLPNYDPQCIGNVITSEYINILRNRR